MCWQLLATECVTGVAFSVLSLFLWWLIFLWGFFRAFQWLVSWIKTEMIKLHCSHLLNFKVCRQYFVFPLELSWMQYYLDQKDINSGWPYTFLLYYSDTWAGRLFHFSNLKWLYCNSNISAHLSPQWLIWLCRAIQMRGAMLTSLLKSLYSQLKICTVLPTARQTKHEEG